MTELDWLKKAEKAIMVVALVVGVALVVSGFRFISVEDTAVRFVLGGVTAVGSGIFLWNRRRAQARA